MELIVFEFVLISVILGQKKVGVGQKNKIKDEGGKPLALGT